MPPGFTNREENGFFGARGSYSRTHQTVFNSHETVQHVRHDHVRFLTKVAVPTGRKTVARRGAVKVQANMWPVS